MNNTVHRTPEIKTRTNCTITTSNGHLFYARRAILHGSVCDELKIGASDATHFSSSMFLVSRLPLVAKLGFFGRLQVRNRVRREGRSSRVIPQNN
jgi:hypothetical protein